jgi:hypothetical protein
MLLIKPCADWWRWYEQRCSRSGAYTCIYNRLVVVSLSAGSAFTGFSTVASSGLLVVFRLSKCVATAAAIRCAAAVQR